MKEIGAPALPEDINRDLLTSPHSLFSYILLKGQANKITIN